MQAGLEGDLIVGCALGGDMIVGCAGRGASLRTDNTGRQCWQSALWRRHGLLLPVTAAFT